MLLRKWGGQVGCLGQVIMSSLGKGGGKFVLVLLAFSVMLKFSITRSKNISSGKKLPHQHKTISPIFNSAGLSIPKLLVTHHDDYLTFWIHPFVCFIHLYHFGFAGANGTLLSNFFWSEFFLSILSYWMVFLSIHSLFVGEHSLTTKKTGHSRRVFISWNDLGFTSLPPPKTAKCTLKVLFSELQG